MIRDEIIEGETNMENKRLTELREELEKIKKLGEPLENKIREDLNIITADLERDLKMSEGYSVLVRADLYGGYRREVSLAIAKDDKGLFGQSISILIEFEKKLGFNECSSKEVAFYFNPLGGMGIFNIEENAGRSYAIHLQSLMLQNYEKYINVMTSPEVETIEKLQDKEFEIKEEIKRIKNA